MADIFVDPIIIVVPAASADEEEVVAYLNTLSSWLEEALHSPHSWFYATDAARKLLESGLYPHFELLRHWQRLYRIDMSTHQISTLLNQVFREESNLEPNLEKLGYLIEHEPGSIIISPEQFTARWPAPIKDEMYPLLAKVGACKHMAEAFAQELRIATLALSEGKREIEVVAKITASVPDFTWNEQPFTQSFALLFTPDDLPPPTDVLNQWDQGEKGVRYIIDYWYRHDWQSSVAKPLSYNFSPSFFDSIARHGLDTNEIILTRIMRAAATIIAKKAKDVKSYNLRQLRENKTGDSKQRTRPEDDAKAWRLTITSDGVGWRMHYWYVVTPEGASIEFANILKKHDPEDIY